jgi:hypothetical protein
MIALGLSAFTIAANSPPAAEKPAKERFDMTVREDIFAGFGGNKDRLATGLKRCEEALAKNPKHAEALVWRGAVRVFQAGQAFQNQKRDDGLALWTSGTKDLDDAVALEPKNIGVRIPRAVVLMPAAHNVPEGIRKPLVAKIIDDFQTIYDLQKDSFDKLGTHPRGELRMGMADAYRLAGELAKSQEQLKAVVKDLPDTKYAERAKEWLAAKDDAKLVHNCIGCHRPK